MTNRWERTRPWRIAHRATLALVTATALFTIAAVTAASAEPNAMPTKLSAVLKASPLQDVARPNARGTFRAVYSLSAHSLRFRLTYSGLSGPVLRAELHIGKITHAGFTGRYPLCDDHSVRCVAGRWITIEQVFPDLFVELGRQGGYIDLHTLKNTEGEAAGKLSVSA